MTKHYTAETIQHDLIEILNDMIADWDLATDQPMSTATRLIEHLGFESIDVVQFIGAIEDRYQVRGMPFEELVMQDGRYVDEITIGDTVRFLVRYLNPRY